MAINLTQASILSRKGIRYAIIGLVAIIILRFALQLGVKAFRYFFPPAPPKPTVSFEVLPKLPFIQEDPDRVGKLTYQLETISGSLPKLSTQANVYFMPKTPSSILSLDRAKDTAAKLGFSPNGKEVVETVYDFPSPNYPSSLSMNIINGIFSISYDLTADPEVINTIPPSPQVAKDAASKFLSSADLLNDDIKDQISHSFLRIENGKFTPALSLSDANFTKVNFYRGEYSDLPSVTSSFNEGNVWFIFAGDAKSTSRGKIISGEYHYFPISEQNSSTYPLKTAEQAYEELKNGQGYVAQFGTGGDTITIREVYLAYYDPGQYVEFYQPVVVFEGDNGFVAYVPAVTDDYYGATSSQK